MKIEILIFLFLSVILGVGFLFVLFKVFKKMYLNILGIGENLNLASAILISALLYSVGSFVSYSMVPVRNLYTVLTGNSQYTLLSLIGYIVLFLIMATLLGFAINFISFKTFDLLTKVDEAEEIRKNNVPVALIVATIIIIAVSISKESYTLFLDSLIPYPDLIYKN